MHALVLVSRLHRPALHALALARAIRPDVISAVTLAVDDDETRRLRQEWESRDIPVPLTVLDAPYRDPIRPLINYVKDLRRANPRTVIMVFIPEYVVTHWWQQLLHNQSALRFKARLLFTPGVVVVSVPYHLGVGERRAGSGRRHREPEPDTTMCLDSPGESYGPSRRPRADGGAWQRDRATGGAVETLPISLTCDSGRRPSRGRQCSGCGRQ